jgi:sterol desaturase/sphingolipid hydroxylase (fatty acid hydroxylase superfamily)
MLWMFFCSLELGTLSTHSGYNLPWNFNALQHDWHHYSFLENFGPSGILDELHGSNKKFKGWLAELARRDGKGDRRTLMKAREELAKLEPLQVEAF